MTVRRLLVGAGLCVAALLQTAPPAAAHAGLVSTDPADGEVLRTPPASLHLVFGESVALDNDGAQLYDAGGDPVPVAVHAVENVVTVTPEQPLERGSHVLVYRVVSADSHPINGSVGFAVKAASRSSVAPPSSAPNAFLAHARDAVQATAYVALFLAAGTALFLTFLLPNAAPRALRSRLGQIVRRMSAWAVIAAVGLVPTGVAYRGTFATGGREEVLVVLLVLVGLTCICQALPEGRPTWSRRLLVCAGSVAAIGSLACVGHTRSFGPSWLVVGSDVLHCVAGATWLGGLVGLALSLKGLPRDIAAMTLARFSLLAGGLLAFVAAAGVLLGWTIVGSWSALLDTAYGRVLVAKVGLVTLVVAVAAWNRWRLVPRARRGGSHASIGTTLRAEAALLVAVLGVTGWLGNLAPRPPQPLAQAVVVASAQGIRVVGRMYPSRVGANTVTLHLESVAGRPWAAGAPPTVTASSGPIDLGEKSTTDLGNGTYRLRMMVPVAGAWTMRVRVRSGRFDSTVLTLRALVTR